MTVRLGLVGYGFGGRAFHAPYIAASHGCELTGIVARSPERVSEARADHPGVPVYASLGDMIAAGVDAVTVSTPPSTRRELVLEALEARVHVVADKPFAPTAAAARELLDAATSAGRVLNVFHNRRYDTDLVTAHSVLASGALGHVARLDLRFDLDEPGTVEAGPDGGLLRDLGSHLVDQALTLMGPAQRVQASLDRRDLPDGPTDVGFALSIDHVSGANSRVSASKLSRFVSREIRLHGTDGSYRSDFTDVQTAAILAGRRPAIEGRERWGFEVEERWGVLATGDRRVPVPSLQGDYAQFYDQFADAVQHGGQGPVPAGEGIAVLEVLDAARESADAGRVVEIRR